MFLFVFQRRGASWVSVRLVIRPSHDFRFVFEMPGRAAEKQKHDFMCEIL